MIDFASWPERLETARAGLLLAVPDLAALDLPALAAAAGYPGARIIPAVNWLLSLLALKLTRTRRVSHVDDLLTDPTAGLFAGMAVLPKKSALTPVLLPALPRPPAAVPRGPRQADDQQRPGHRRGSSLDLDFHAVIRWGHDPVLEKHYVPTRSQRARSVLTFFAQDTGTHNLVYASADISKATQSREAIAFCDHWKAVSGSDPKMLIMDQKVAAQEILGELDARGVRFATLRMRSASLIRYINSLKPADYTAITLDRPGPHNKPQGPRGPRRETDQLPRHRPPADRHRPGTQQPTVIITNDDQIKTRALVSPVRPPDDHRTAARRDHPRVLRRRAVLHRQPQRRPRRHARRPRPALTAAIRTRLPGYAAATPDTIQRRFLETPGPIPSGDTITVQLETGLGPVLRKADLPAGTRVPWWGGRTIRYQLA